jgi:hypothetical protein
MPLVGGGGASNTVGAGSAAGTGTSLNYIGNHCYANSGKIAVDNNETTLLEFSTGNQYIVATVTFAYNANAGDDYKYMISIDSQIIDEYHVNGGSNAPDRNARKVLLPPFATIKMSAQNTTDTSANDQTVTLVGRVYA